MVSTKEALSFIKSAKKGKLIIFCVGNEMRGDDGIGLVIYKRLREKIPKDILLYDVGSSLENYLSVIAKNQATHCLIIDAVDFGQKEIIPGTIGFFKPSDLQKNQTMFTTHYIPMNVFLDYLKKDSEVKIRILGIQPKTIEFGTEMSTEVHTAIDKIMNFLIPLLQEGSTKN